MSAIRFFLVSAVVFLLDQATKLMVLNLLKGHPEVPLLGRWLSFNYTENRGGAFGILQHGSYVFIISGLLVVGALLYFRRRIVQLPPWQALAFGLVLGGTLGNLLDRLRIGYVVDFIDFHWWPVFNVADSAICIGLTIIGVMLVRSDAPRHGPAEGEPG